MDQPRQSTFSPTNQPQPQRERLPADWLATRIAMVLSAYRRDDYSDPDSFVMQVALNLERFPAAVIEYVTDPLTGIQSRCKWPPSVAEMVEACRAAVARCPRARRPRPVAR